MQGYYRYLPAKNFTNPFKITVQNGGYVKTPPGQPYPDTKHPANHYFDFKDGRILNEYQILYILEGGGKFESRTSGKLELNEGDVFFLFPGEWHRYRPNKSTGWQEYWIGFTSNFSDFFENNSLISRKSPIVKIGLDEFVLDLYNQTLDTLKNYNVGADYLLSGAATHLLSYILAQKARIDAGYSEHINNLINKAKITISNKINMQLSPQEIAEELNISYSWFRRIFKKYTSFTPKEYQIELQLSMAKNLLLTTENPVKEIAFESGFNSQYHFSKIFKQKNNVSPIEYRKKMKLPFSPS
jgi:AraC-like DNA-binding protein